MKLGCVVPAFPTGPIALPGLGRSRPGLKNSTWLWWVSNLRPYDPLSDAPTTTLRRPSAFFVIMRARVLNTYFDGMSLLVHFLTALLGHFSFLLGGLGLNTRSFLHCISCTICKISAIVSSWMDVQLHNIALWLSLFIRNLSIQKLLCGLPALFSFYWRRKRKSSYTFFFFDRTSLPEPYI